MLNDKMVITRFVSVERRVLRGSLHTITEVHILFTCQRLEWMAKSLQLYRKEVVKETLKGSLDRRVNPVKRTHSQRFYFEAARWEFLLPPSAASCMMCPMVP